MAQARQWLSDLRRRTTWSEGSGAVGDLGTFLPLLVGLTQTVGLDLGTTLVFTGVYNIATGLLFDIPMPVQPMKAIAAVAIASGDFDLPCVMAAGIFVGAVVLVLGVTRLIDAFHRLVPGSVIRGVQLSVGLNLAQKGVALVAFHDAQHYRGITGWEGLVPGVVAACFILVTVYWPAERESLSARQPAALPTFRSSDEGSSGRGRSLLGPVFAAPGSQAAGAGAPAMGTQGGSHGSLSHWLPPSSEDAEQQQPMLSQVDEGEKADAQIKVPAALIVVLLGLAAALLQHPHVASQLRLGPSTPRLVLPTQQQWLKGIVGGGLPQLPLTALNSVVAVTQLSGDLFPGREAQPAVVSISVGLMNLIGPWLGALPCCHGAGGLAAQVRFGARSGAAPILLGVGKLLAGLLFGSSLLALLQAFPKSLLGAMLIFSGAELASAVRHQSGERGVMLMLLTAAAINALKNTGLGFLAGLGAAALLEVADRGTGQLPDLLRRWRSQASG